MYSLSLVLFSWLFILGDAQWNTCFPEKALLDSTKQEVDRLANLVYNRFELHRLQQLQLFLVSSNILSHSWEIIKMKLAEKMLEPGSNFTMVFGGTGVTAGYDNFLHQSYPMVIEKRLTPIFKALGIKLVVKNIGQIHVDCRLSNYCYEAMGGTTADVIGWENSFDCGAAKDAHEFIARVAGWKSAVIHFSTSGAFPIDDCPPAEEKVPWIDESWTPEVAGISERIALDAANVQDFKRLQDAWARAGSAAGRFMKPLGDKYEGVGAHGFSLWAKSTMVCDYRNAPNMSSGTVPNRWYSTLTADLANVEAVSNKNEHDTMKRALGDTFIPVKTVYRQLQNNYKRKVQPVKDSTTTAAAKTKISSAKIKAESYCEAVKLKGKCHADGGPHWRVQESAHFGNAQQRGRKWHPSIGMHLLRAEMFVYTYVHIIMDALLMVEGDALRAAQQAAELHDSGSKNKKKNSKKSKASKGAAVPAGCSAAAVAVKAEYQSRLKALQVPVPSEPLHCAKKECAAMPQCYTDYLPNYNTPHLLKSIIVGSHLGWYPESALANDLNPELGLLDKKHYYKSEGSKNELHLQLTGVRTHVRVYARSKKEPLDEALFILDPHIHVARNTSVYKSLSAYRPTQQRYTLPQANYSTEQNYATVAVPPGDHVFTIMTAPSNPFAISSVSHIVVF